MLRHSICLPKLYECVPKLLQVLQSVLRDAPVGPSLWRADNGLSCVANDRNVQTAKPARVLLLQSAREWRHQWAAEIRWNPIEFELESGIKTEGEPVALGEPRQGEPDRRRSERRVAHKAININVESERPMKLNFEIF